MQDAAFQFPPHGSTRFEARGQLLLLYSSGPFNAEHVKSLVPAFQAHAGPLSRNGPWATINIIRDSVMTTPECIDAMRRSAIWTRDTLGRVAAAYAIAEDVEGRRLMEPLLVAACDDIIPTRFFLDLDSASAWAQRQVEAARTRSG